jgi:hypothetical protein
MMPIAELIEFLREIAYAEIMDAHLRARAFELLERLAAE